VGRIVPDAVEAYLASMNRAGDAVLEEIAQEGRAEGMPLIDAEVGAFLQLLARAVGARRVLEIGTAIGYSTIWLARSLPPDGLLLSLEIDRGRARRARANLERAGVQDRTSVMVGDARRLVAKVAGPFDLIFQDGDKRLYTPLLDRLVELLRPGGLLVTDNLLWDGEVVPGFTSNPTRSAEDTRAIVDYNSRLTADGRLLTSIVPLRDGLGVSLKR
jgi:predicted O-methyltransferase YrrM